VVEVCLYDVSLFPGGFPGASLFVLLVADRPTVKSERFTYHHYKHSHHATIIIYHHIHHHY